MMLRLTFPTCLRWMFISAAMMVLAAQLLVAQKTAMGPFGNRDIEVPNLGEVRVVAFPAGAKNYHWSNGWQTPTIFVSDTGWYWVDVMVDSIVLRDSVHFHMGPRCFDIPNMLTPNGEIYDCISLGSACALDTMHFVVYDRWGLKMYETSNPDDCWNGENEGRFLEEGVYTYVLDWAIEGGYLRRRTAIITVIR